MAVFSNLILTNAAKDMLAQILSGGAEIQFTRFVISQHAYSAEEIPSMTAVQDITGQAEVSDITCEEDYVTVSGLVKSSETTGYYLQTAALYASADGTEYVYAAAIAQTADYIPAPVNGRYTSIGLSFVIGVSDTSVIDITVSQTAAVTQAQLAETNAAVEAVTKTANDASNTAVKAAADIVSIVARTETAESNILKLQQSSHTHSNKAVLDGIKAENLLVNGNAPTATKATELSSGAMRYGYFVNNSETAEYGYVWFRVATVTLSGGYTTNSLVLHVTSGGARYGVLSVVARNDSTGKNCESLDVRWACKDKYMMTETFKLVAVNGTNDVTYELWGQIPARYHAIFCTVISDALLIGGNANKWKIESHSDSDAKTATTTGNKSVTSTDASQAANLTDTGWLTLTGNVKYRKIGKIVEVRGTYTAPNSGGSLTIGTLPTGYRPSNATVYNTNSISDTASKTYYTSVNTSGTLIISSSSGSAFTQGVAYNVNIMFMVD